MIRMLFVSANQGFLADVEKQLQPHREWEVHTTSTVDAALGELGSGRFDVVVAEAGLNTPHGGSLLVHVKETQPAAVRIVLGGEGAAHACLAVAHQVLNRPVDSIVVRSVLARSIELRSRLTDPTVLELLGSLPSLPSPSGALLELQRVLAEPEIDTMRVAKVVSSDMAMSAKLLQIVNSSYYGLSRSVEDPAESVRLLGSRLVGEILLTVGLLDAITKRGSGVDAQLTEMRDRALARADLAAALADKAGRAPVAARRVWNGAFLHDVGEMLLVGTPREHDPEMERLHATIGGALLAMWGLPPQLVEVVALGDLPPSSASSEAHLYTWLADEFLHPAVPVDGDETAAAEHSDLVASVIRWTGLASFDLSQFRSQPAAA
jgi:HD-like signal output (HDOD) protein